MIWSLTKIVCFIIIVALLALGGTWLAQIEGTTLIQFHTYEFNLSPLKTVISLIVLFAVGFIIYKALGLVVAFIRFLFGDETALSRYLDKNREKRGYDALSEGLVALASGDSKKALSKVAKAERYLGKPEITNILKAQAAGEIGDKRTQSKAYKALIKDEKTRFIGIKGLVKQKLELGDTKTALKLAEHALAIKPQHVETQDTLLRLQAQSQDWGSARKTLSNKLTHGAISRDIYKRRDAVLALAQAKLLSDDSETKKTTALQANKNSPDLIPAAVMAADTHSAEGNLRLATKILKKAWSVQPHPDLAAAFARIVPDETPQTRLKRFKSFIKNSLEHSETKMLLAELYLAAENFPEARRALGKLNETEPTARSFTLLAAIERGEGACETAVRGFLTRALTASRGPQWVCDNCGSIHSEWLPICQSCDSLDTLSWCNPEHSENAMPLDTALLPMLIDAPSTADAQEVDALNLPDIADITDANTATNSDSESSDDHENGESKSNT